jgi:hypothetical protein
MKAAWKTTTAVALIAGAMTSASTALADDEAAAQALFDQAKKAMAAQQYADACPKFEASLRMQEALGTLLNLADCYERAGKTASAWSKFLELAAKARAAGQTERARIGRVRAAALAPKLSNLVIDVPAASRVEGLEVRKDGRVVVEAEWGASIPADPGPHLVEASAPGHSNWSQTVDVPDGAKTAHAAVPELPTVAAPLPLASAPATPADHSLARPSVDSPPEPGRSPGNGRGMKIAAIAVGAVGVVGIGVGSVFGWMSLSKHNHADTECPPNGTCLNADAVSTWRDAVHFGNVSTVAFAVGGAALATGAVLWFVAPKSAGARREARLAVGPGGVAVDGVW